MDIWSTVFAVIAGGVLGWTHHWVLIPMLAVALSLFDLAFRRKAFLEQVPGPYPTRTWVLAYAGFYTISSIVYALFLVVGFAIGRLIP
jgi:hypothetical protein